MINRARRSLFHGRLRADPAPPRPPWSVAEVQFTERCERCDRCITACPASILHRGAGGFPEIDFSRGGCDFCGACAAACQVEAITSPLSSPWQIELLIGDECLARRGVVCRSCAEQCDGAIRFRPALNGLSLPLIEAQRCSGCGRCIAPCPVAAISLRPVISQDRSREAPPRITTTDPIHHQEQRR